ncbi:hypothetical protein RB195_001968 [Necator americanus]|uniref:Endonuclease/exonuclease/phosphatase domain-containing protein n=1 Tax=Necator americanus TaxID=51031 RepID=A0ABR1DHV3_NECAM
MELSSSLTRHRHGKELRLLQTTYRLNQTFVDEKCGPTPASTILVAYAPGYGGDIETFRMDLEMFYREDYTFYKVIVGDFNAKIGLRRTPEGLHIGIHGLQRNEHGGAHNSRSPIPYAEHGVTR